MPLSWLRRELAGHGGTDILLSGCRGGRFLEPPAGTLDRLEVPSVLAEGSPVLWLTCGLSTVRSLSSDLQPTSGA